MGKLGEPGAHKTTHQDDGSDEINVAGLAGLLAADQHVLDNEVLAVAIAKTLLTTKGDLMSYSTVLARLGIGTDTHVLTADSGEALGMKWAAVAGDGATMEFFAPAGFGTELTFTGYYPVYKINEAADFVYIGFYVPLDFTTLTSVVLVVFSNTTATHRLNFGSWYGAKDTLYTTHGETQNDVDTALTTYVLTEIDIVGVLASLATGDYVGVKVLGDSTNIPNLQVLGIRLKYA